MYLSTRIINLARAARLALPILLACATSSCLTSCVKSETQLNASAVEHKLDANGQDIGQTETKIVTRADGTRIATVTKRNLNGHGKVISTVAVSEQIASDSAHDPTAAADRVTVEEVAAVAEKADRDYVDGWIDGRDPRVFKSYYKTLTPVQKAEFAMAYHDMVEKSDQNLAQSYKTYIPYKKRVAFARNYWENSQFGAKFKSEIEKMQVAWIHESLLDGSELWWRAAEGRFGNRISSPSQMAHDVEQNMVSKYMEDEGTESTFSQQMTDKTKIKTKTN